MEEELTEQSVTLNTRQMSWLTGGLGASSNNYTKSELRQMQQDTGLEYIHMAPERRCVVLVGTRSAVAAGVEWLEARRNMTVELYHIPKEQLGWVIGKKGVHIKELKEESGVDAIQVRDEEDGVVLKGSMDTVGAARVWLDCHIAYFLDIQATEEHIETVRRQLGSLPLIRGQPVQGAPNPNNTRRSQ